MRASRSALGSGTPRPAQQGSRRPDTSFGELRQDALIEPGAQHDPPPRLATLDAQHIDLEIETTVGRCAGFYGVVIPVEQSRSRSGITPFSPGLAACAERDRTEEKRSSGHAHDLRPISPAHAVREALPVIACVAPSGRGTLYFALRGGSVDGVPVWAGLGFGFGGFGLDPRSMRGSSWAGSRTLPHHISSPRQGRIEGHRLCGGQVFSRPAPPDLTRSRRSPAPPASLVVARDGVDQLSRQALPGGMGDVAET